MSRTGLKRVDKSSATGKKTRSSSHQQQKQQQQQQTRPSTKKPSSMGRSGSGKKVQALTSTKKGTGVTKNRDEQERAKVDGEVKRLTVAREGLRVAAVDRQIRPSFSATRGQPVDSSLSQTFQSLMK